MSGSGNVDAEGIEADAFEVLADGSGDVELDGTTGRLVVDIDGSGNADLAALAAREARVSVGGSGDAEVRAAENSTSASTAQAACAITAIRPFRRRSTARAM